MTKKPPAKTKAVRSKAKPRGRPIAPGQVLNPKGRPKGSRNRLSEAFLQEFCDDWDKNGAAIIAKVREESPTKYLEIAAKLLPAQIEVSASVNVFEKVWTAISAGVTASAAPAAPDKAPIVIDETPMKSKH